METVDYLLQHYLFDDALFFVEYLLSNSNNNNNNPSILSLLLVYTKLLFQKQEYKSVYHTLHQPKYQQLFTQQIEDTCWEHVIFALGRSCYELQKWNEARSWFEYILKKKTNTIAMETIYYYTALTFKRENNSDLAYQFFNKALELNPLLWTAYEMIHCQSNSSASSIEFPTTTTTHLQEWNEISPIVNPKANLSDSDFHTPSPKIASSSSYSQHQKLLFSSHPSTPISQIPNHTLLHKTGPSQLQHMAETPKRKLFQSREGTPVVVVAAATQQQSSLSNSIQQPPTQQQLYSQIKPLIEALQLMRQFKCKECLQLLHSSTYSVSFANFYIYRLMRANCYFELGEYIMAEQLFDQCLKEEPHRLYGLDVYSSTLWNLKKEKKLSYLAHHMSQIDKLSCYTLCTIGNCFSLQRDHETAKKFFKKAQMVNPQYAYAYTLCGLEYFTMEEFDEALQCFEEALQVDEKHYNAWYGIGMVYFRKEDYEKALFHFKKALSINNNSFIIYSYLGMTLCTLKRYLEAIKMFQMALKLSNYSSTNHYYHNRPMIHFKLANVYFQLQDYESSLRELDILKNLVPREPDVYLSYAEIFKKMSLFDKSLHFYNIALDLEFRDANKTMIRDQIAKLNQLLQ